MRRRSVISLILIGVLAFLVISALLARALTIGDAEQSALASLAQAEASGSPGAVVKLMHDCTAACRVRSQTNAAALRRAGHVSVIQVQPSASFSLTSTLGTARVAWIVGSSLPRVQCVRVRHAGNVLSGFTVQLLHVSLRIKSNENCPRNY